MAIGYELKLAPLQTLAFYNAVANGGVKVAPMIVRDIKQADQVVEHFETQVLNPKICSDATLRKLHRMLEGVVLEGTARKIQPKDYAIAGKTGTAWKFKNGRYTKTYSTSFCGFFPADKPKYSCIVVIDSPSKGGWSGAEVAAPVFREVADKCMARDQASQRPMLARVPARRTPVPLVRAGLQDEIALVCQKIGLPGQTQATGGEEWVRATKALDTAFVARTVALRPDASVAHPGRMPDVRGLTLRDALFLLENRGLKVQASGTGRVREQSVAPGSFAKRGLVVGLLLTPTAAPTAAPAALPAPLHTEVAENTLLIPAEMGGSHAKSLAKAATAASATSSAKKSDKPAVTKSKGDDKATATKSKSPALATSAKTDKADKADKPTKKSAGSPAKQKAGKPETQPRKPAARDKADIRTTQRAPEAAKSRKSA
jgi:cell division protein FtsI (penicillin-binding protein 3)